MNSKGLLYYDDSPIRSLAEKVQDACAAYRRKFSQHANICYVHESAIGTSALTAAVDGVRVVMKKWALLHHYQAGREDE